VLIFLGPSTLLSYAHHHLLLPAIFLAVVLLGRAAPSWPPSLSSAFHRSPCPRPIASSLTGSAGLVWWRLGRLICVLALGSIRRPRAASRSPPRGSCRLHQIAWLPSLSCARRGSRPCLARVACLPASPAWPVSLPRPRGLSPGPEVEAPGRHLPSPPSPWPAIAISCSIPTRSIEDFRSPLIADFGHLLELGPSEICLVAAVSSRL
jgi:hypothetical protein